MYLFFYVGLDTCVTLMHETETDFTPSCFGGKTFVWPPGLLGETENRDYNIKIDVRKI
jgi:hypothetical protein